MKNALKEAETKKKLLLHFTFSIITFLLCYFFAEFGIRVL